MKTQKSVRSNEVFNQSEEELMKDYRLEELENVYGDLIEEILVEVFSIEGEREVIDERSIYDLSTEEEICKRLERERELLNEGGAAMDNIELLERQARKYFDNPVYVYTPEDEVACEWVTGFIQVNAGLKFDSNGKPVELWKSFGQKLVCDVEQLSDPEEIIKKVEETGIQWSDMVRIVFYGKSLQKFVGYKIYATSEVKELAPLCDAFKGIQLAIPSYEDCDSEESIFSRIDELVKESILYGNDPGIDRVAMGHYELTLVRLEELKLEEAEISNSERILQKQKRNIEKRNDFDAHFKEARNAIKALNLGEVKVSQLFDKDSKFLGQMMYLCQKKGERIENPALFFQLKALASKRKCEEIYKSRESEKAIQIINKINSGDLVEVHLLGLDDLQEVFDVLWSGTGIRINNEYKAIYFELKERFTNLKRLNDKAAA